MQIFNNYFDLEKQIHEYFKYKKECTVYPLADHSNYYWMILDHKVVYSDEPFSLSNIREGQGIYSAAFYGHKHLWSADKYTLVRADTQTDGNKFLMIFDNQKRTMDETLKSTYRNLW